MLNAARSFGDEPVLVLWPDDVFVAEVPRAQQLIRAYELTGCPVLALMPMDPPTPNATACRSSRKTSTTACCASPAWSRSRSR